MLDVWELFVGTSLGKEPRSWDQGQEDRHKEPPRPRLMLCHFCTNVTKKSLWDLVVVSCQKEASAAPQQGHSFEGKVLIYCSSHLPPWLHTLLQCTAWATRCGKPSMVRRYARRRVCDCEVMEVTFRPASLTLKGLRGYISCACVQCVQGTLSRSVYLETIFLKACVCFLALLWHITTAWMV